MDIPRNKRSFAIENGPSIEGFFDEAIKSFRYQPFSTSFQITYENTTPEGEPICGPMAIEGFHIQKYEQTGPNSLRFWGNCKVDLNGNSHARTQRVNFSAEYDADKRKGRISFGR